MTNSVDAVIGRLSRAARWIERRVHTPSPEELEKQRRESNLLLRQAGLKAMADAGGDNEIAMELLAEWADADPRTRDALWQAQADSFKAQVRGIPPSKVADLLDAVERLDLWPDAPAELLLLAAFNLHLREMGKSVFDDAGVNWVSLTIEAATTEQVLPVTPRP